MSTNNTFLNINYKFLILLVVFLIGVLGVYAHGEEDGHVEVQEESMAEVLKSKSVAYVIVTSIFILALVLFSIFLKKRSESLNWILFLGIALPVIFATVYLAGSTIYLNTTSVTKGPVHWHADYQIFACGERLQLVDPEGISNKIGSSVMHEHNDDRMHVEGVVMDLEDVNLGNYFEIAGGHLEKNLIMLPTNEGQKAYGEGDLCKGQESNLKVYVNGKKIENPEKYVPSPEQNVPPGDCILFEFSQGNAETTDKLCESWEANEWTYENQDTMRSSSSTENSEDEHDNSDGHHDMDGMEDISHEIEEMSDMEDQKALEDLPLEESQSTLDPEIIYEDGKEIKVFRMWIEAIKKEIRPGVYVEAWGFNRQVPGPELRVDEGDNVRVIFENKHNKDHTIHWHGQHVQNSMDGVPGITQQVVKPKETFTYEFVAGPSGTHAYHCHVDTDHHIDMGMYGPFIVEDPAEDNSKYDREIVWMLSSFNTKKHDHIAEESDYFSGHAQYKAEKDAFLINGKAFPATTPISVKENELIKMRLINMGKEPYSMHMHGHSFIVTHKDGFPVENKQEMDTLPILPGERYDLEMRMKNKGAWVFHDHITPHVTNDGFYPGGMIGLILYENFEIPESLRDLLGKITEYNKKATEMEHVPESMEQEDHSMHME
ncbi:multicopper oxidase domain-containing protein [Candidatus Woesearchaeota archaeon]|nr:multicopper oxidase domain-containing protein [Candidatus Woesearchaeota archaeon]